MLDSVRDTLRVPLSRARLERYRISRLRGTLAGLHRRGYLRLPRLTISRPGLGAVSSSGIALVSAVATVEYHHGIVEGRHAPGVSRYLDLLAAMRAALADAADPRAWLGRAQDGSPLALPLEDWLAWYVAGTGRHGHATGWEDCWAQACAWYSHETPELDRGALVEPDGGAQAQARDVVRWAGLQSVDRPRGRHVRELTRLVREAGAGVELWVTRSGAGFTSLLVEPAGEYWGIRRGEQARLDERWARDAELLEEDSGSPLIWHEGEEIWIPWARVRRITRRSDWWVAWCVDQWGRHFGWPVSDSYAPRGVTVGSCVRIKAFVAHHYAGKPPWYQPLTFLSRISRGRVLQG